MAATKSKNMRAFLGTIAFSEGTDNGKQVTHDHGYDVIVGGSTFSDYKDHPRKLIDLPKLGIKSSGSGRYQILSGIFDHYKKQLNLPDFSPESQDAIAMQLIKECRATQDVEDGSIASALVKCRSRWASLPGAGYGQHEHGMDTLLAEYEKRRAAEG